MLWQYGLSVSCFYGLFGITGSIGENSTAGKRNNVINWLISNPFSRCHALSSLVHYLFNLNLLYLVLFEKMNKMKVVDQLIILRVIFSIVLIMIGLGHETKAQLVAERLSNTSQLNPDQFPIILAANMIFSGQPPGIGGSVNGVEFEDVIWGNETNLQNDVEINGSVAGGIRTANVLGSLSGEGADVLAAIANSINYYNVGTDGTITFTNLPAGLPVLVQMITSDAAASVNNWGGVFSLSVIDTVTQGSVQIITFDAGTDSDNLDAQLVTFSAEVDGNGALQVFVDQTRPGHHAGISGIVVLAAGQVLPLQISSLVINQEQPGVTIEWKSGTNRIYAIEVSDDLMLWEELDDNVTSEGDTTTFTDTQIPLNSSRRFYRVHEMER